MEKMSVVKKMVLCAVCIALCCVLPVALHPLGLGSVLSPLHLPVLLCGLVCGWGYGAVCGVLGPVLSHLTSGMPPVTGLVSRVPELMVYGLVTGLCMRYIRTGRLLPDLYIALPVAMVLGRIVGGIAKALFLFGSGKGYGIALWFSGYFVETLPGIAVQLLLIPVLVMALTRARVIAARYPRTV